MQALAVAYGGQVSPRLQTPFLLKNFDADQFAELIFCWLVVLAWG